MSAHVKCGNIGCVQKKGVVLSPPFIMGDQSGKKDKNSRDATSPPVLRRGRNKSYVQATNTSSAMGTIDELSDFINPEAFAKSSIDDKLSTVIASLNKLHNKFDNIHDELHDKESGVFKQLYDVVGDVKDCLDNLLQTQAEMKIVKGILAKQEQQIASLSQQIQEITKKQMSENIVISGVFDHHFEVCEKLLEAPMGSSTDNLINLIKEVQKGLEESDQDLKALAAKFFTDIQKVTVSMKDVLHVYWLGQYEAGRSRQLVVKLEVSKREEVLAKTKNLKGVQNPIKRFYFVNQQVPEAITAQKKKNSYDIAKIKKGNEGRQQHLKTKFKVKKNQLFIGDSKTPVQPKCLPLPSTALFTDRAEQEKIDKIKLFISAPIEDSGSVFTGIVAKTSNITELKRAQIKVRQLYCHATHIPIAYDAEGQRGSYDDGEFSAGLTLEKVVEEQNCKNRAIFVVRMYGGTKLGPVRFKHIKDVAKQALCLVK